MNAYLVKLEKLIKNVKTAESDYVEAKEKKREYGDKYGQPCNVCGELHAVSVCIEKDVNRCWKKLIDAEKTLDDHILSYRNTLAISYDGDIGEKRCFKTEHTYIKQYSGYLYGGGDVQERGYDPHKLIEYLKTLWTMPEWGIRQEGDILELHTGGWSDNEEIINILTHSLFWVMCWQQSRRGGHYYFKINEQ